MFWMKRPVHRLHRAGAKRNYGILVDWCDRLFGTYEPIDLRYAVLARGESSRPISQFRGAEDGVPNGSLSLCAWGNTRLLPGCSYIPFALRPSPSPFIC